MILNPDGQVFSDFMKLTGRARLHACLVENVPAISKHGDFRVLVSGAALDGWTLYISGVYSCQRSAPVYRDRWTRRRGASGGFTRQAATGVGTIWDDDVV